MTWGKLPITPTQTNFAVDMQSQDLNHLGPLLADQVY